MPITVQHGGAGAGTAAGQIIAQAGQADLARQQQSQLALQQITATRDAQMLTIDAQADRDKRSADEAMKRITLEHGLGKEMQDREYDMEVSRMQEQAKVDANQFEWEISTQDRRELTKINNARSSLKKAHVRGEFSPEEFERADRELTLMEMGIEPTRRPAVDKPPSPEEQIFEEPMTKALMGRDRDGNARVLIQPDKRPEYLRWKAEHDREVKREEAANKATERRETAISKYEDYLYELEDEDDRGRPKPRFTRAQIRAKVNERFRGTYELGGEEQQEVVQARLAEKYDYAPEKELPPTPPGQPAQVEQPVLSDQEAETRAAIASQGESEWWGALEAQGVPVSKERRQMPLEKGSALSLYDAYMQRFGSFENVPDELKPALAEIIKTVRKHRGK